MEPVTLAVVGTAVLTEGVKFLFAQAGDVIKWWRDKRTEKVPVPSDAPVEGTLEPANINATAMERLESEIVGLRAALAPYTDDVAPLPVDASNENLLAVTDGLRRALEAVLGQRIRFRGEGGASSGPMVEADVNADDVFGYVSAIRARNIEGGRVKAKITVGTVRDGGQAIGIDVDTISG